MSFRPHIRKLLLLLLATHAVFCQQKTKPAPKPPPARIAAKPPQPGGGNPKTPPPRLNNPLTPVQRFLGMTPDEQERVMEKAPIQQQRRLQAALERFNSLPPAQRARVLRQYQSLARLSPEQQGIVARQIAAFNHLPEDRIKPIREELLQLFRMPPEQRAARLSSEDFASRYSPSERRILEDLASNLPPDYPIAGR